MKLLGRKSGSRARRPSYTVRHPFTPATQWTEVPGVGIAVWRPQDAHVRVQDLSGAQVALLPLPRERVNVSAVDREWWFATTFGVSFAGRQGLFTGLIPEARRRIAFPSHFPATTALLASSRPKNTAAVSPRPGLLPHRYSWLHRNATPRDSGMKALGIPVSAR